MEIGITGALTLLVIGVLIVGAVSVIAGRIGVAAPLVLVAVGIALGAIPGAPAIELEPEVFLEVILPPLIFAAARNVPFVDFRRSIQVIGVLAIGLVIVSALAVGGLVHLLWPTISLALAVALGAVVAPPDAVAATAIAKRIGLPRRDVTILEGEALVNDAAALVVLGLAGGIAASGGRIGPGDAVLALVWGVVAALVAGAAVGYLAVWIRARIADRVLNLTFALVTPFAAFLLAEAVAASGIVAVVVAGLIVGNVGAFRLPVRAREIEGANWGSFSTIVENAAFLYLGYQLPAVIAEVDATGRDLGAVIGMGLLVALALLVVRMAVMPLLLIWMRARAKSMRRRQERRRARLAEVGKRLSTKAPGFERIPGQSMSDERAAKIQALERAGVTVDQRFASRMRRFWIRMQRAESDLTAELDGQLGWRDGVVLGWAGMRGVVTVMAVETLPRLDDQWHALVLVAYVVAISTLLVEGLTLGPLARALHLRDDPERSLDAEVDALYSRIAEFALAHVDRDAADHDSPESARTEVHALVDRWRTRTAERARSSRDGLAEQDVETLRLTDVLLDTELQALRVQREIGEFSSEAIGEVLSILDRQRLARSEYEAAAPTEAHVDEHLHTTELPVQAHPEGDSVR